MKMYELSDEIRHAADLLADPEAQDETIQEELFGYLESLEMELAEKAEYLGKLFRELSAESDAIKEESKLLAEKAKARENQAKRIKEYLAYALNGEKLKTQTFSMYYMNTEAVNVIDESALPDDVFKVVRSVSLSAVKEKLKAGEELLGVELVKNTSLVIR